MAIKTHPVNVAYLVVGLIFLGIAGSWALHAADVVDAGDTRWMVPAVLLVAGVAGLAAATARSLGRNRDDRNPATDTYDPYGTYDTDDTNDTTILERDDR